MNKHSILIVNWSGKEGNIFPESKNASLFSERFTQQFKPVLLVRWTLVPNRSSVTPPGTLPRWDRDPGTGVQVNLCHEHQSPADARAIESCEDASANSLMRGTTRILGLDWTLVGRLCGSELWCLICCDKEHFFRNYVLDRLWNVGSPFWKGGSVVQRISWRVQEHTLQ